jgi:hypothetical protein
MKHGQEDIDHAKRNQQDSECGRHVGCPAPAAATYSSRPVPTRWAGLGVPLMTAATTLV